MLPPKANARRSSYALKLWLDEPGDPSENDVFQTIDGEVHYLPPVEQRARLARAFLYANANYPHEADTPSVAQLRNMSKIAAIARFAHIQKAERRVEEALRDILGHADPFFTAWHALLRRA